MFTLEGYVMVAGGISPYRNSDGGSGRITALHGAGAQQAATVKYTLTNKSEKDIPISRLTSTPMPYHDLITPTRSASLPKSTRVLGMTSPIITIARPELIGRLQAARRTRKHECLGWLRDDDMQYDGKALTVPERRDRTLQCALELKNYVKGAADERGMTVVAYMRHDLRCKGGNMRATSTAESQKGIPKGELSKMYLCWAMGNRPTSSLKKWIKNEGLDGRAKPVYKKGKPRRGIVGLCVIDDLDWATTIFTAKRLYLDAEVGAYINGSDDFLTLGDKTAERKRKAVAWDTTVSF